MASLRKMRNKYYARVYYKDKDGEGREKLISLNTSKKQLALKLKEEVERQEKAYKAGIISIDEISAKEPTNLDKITHKFMDYLSLSERSDKTTYLYKLALNDFREIFQERDITLLSREDYLGFMKEMKRKYPNNVTCNIRLRNIRAFLRWCKDHGEIEKLPFMIEQLPTKKKKPRYFTDSEMKNILAEAKTNEEMYARIWVHWKTGMRLRELSKSYYEEGFIEIYDHIKHGKERTIPIDKETARHYHIAKEGDYIPTTISTKFKEILNKLNYRKTKSGDTRHFHCLRHTFAVRTYYETRDIYRVKVLLGHSSVKTTEKYANFNIAKLERDFDI